ncbi:MAG: ABC transporter permease [Bacteroidales bacterium]|nr:ABC transporter permease [Bacteroidales bacterium]
MTLIELLMPRRRRLVKQTADNPNDSPQRIAWRRFRRNPLAVAGLAIIGLSLLVAIPGYLITPDHTPHCNQQYLELTTLPPGSKANFLITDEQPRQHTSLLKRMAVGEPLPYTATPIYSHTLTDSALYAETYTGGQPNDGDLIEVPLTAQPRVEQRTFLLGTDSYGHDLLSQLMIGSRVSLSVGFIAIAIALLIGITLGALAAYYGGWVDALITWLINVVWSIPTILLVIAITFALGKGFWQVFIAVGLTMWVDIARIVRGQVLSIKEKDYVEAARALGYSTPRIIFRHILPGCLGPVIVVTASNFASAILLEAGLSFLGIGVQPPMVSWGSMVKENYNHILLGNAYLALLPGLAIMLIVLAFMMLGNGLQESLETKKQ